MRSVDICLCTYRRDTLLDVLRSLSAQVVDDDVTLRVIVADNDVTPSARFGVAKMAHNMRWPVCYVHAPAQNVSTARNACLERATAQWVACIDDDETAPSSWILELLAEIEQHQADVVFAPSQADYPSGAPRWMILSDVHSNRPGQGPRIAPHTSNVMFRWQDTNWQMLRFDESLGKSGGEDTAFFAEMQKMGARFVATSRAAVTEKIPRSRLTFKWLARRRFREGQTHFDVFLRDAGWLPIFGACTKICACMLMALTLLPSRRKSLLWALRAVRQAGVLFGYFSATRPVHYGAPIP